MNAFLPGSLAPRTAPFVLQQHNDNEPAGASPEGRTVTCQVEVRLPGGVFHSYPATAHNTCDAATAAKLKFGFEAKVTVNQLRGGLA